MDRDNVREHRQSAYEIFKNGSKTYFYSSWFFPEQIRKNIVTLYAFVRTADNFVDDIPQDSVGFYRFVDQYRTCLQGEMINNTIISEFVLLMNTYSFLPEWVDASLYSMEMDLSTKTYKTVADLETYIYGSADVIGLMIAKILHLDNASLPYAAKLGASMQLINMIRDIDEDLTLGRIYIPQEIIKRVGITSFTKQELSTSFHDEFCTLIVDLVQLYLEWQNEAENGFQYIPKKYRIPIKTASEMYKWTAKKIQQNPLVIFEKKIKPSKRRIFTQGIYESVFS